MISNTLARENNSQIQKYSSHRSYRRTKLKPYLIAMYLFGFLTNRTSAKDYKCFQNKTELQNAVNVYINEGGHSPIDCPDYSISPENLRFILNKHNIDNQAVTYHFNFNFKYY